MTDSDRPTGASPPEPGEPWSILRLIRWSAGYLNGKGIEEGRLDGEHLLADALGLDRLDLYLQFDRPLTDEELARFKPALLRRARREPLQHILGRTMFRELEMAVDARALIPRPETEVLVETVLDWARAHGGAVPEKGRMTEGGEAGALVALDVGTGTGAIALSLAREGPFTKVVATDPSEEALELARENRDAHGLEETVQLRRGSLFDPVERGERFHVLVSNPPYIAEGDGESLEPEVRDWEPGEALFAGSDGLDVIRPLVAGAGDVLHSGGLLALEVGEGQADDVATLVRGTGVFEKVSVERDLAGRDRIVSGRRAPTPAE